MTPALWSQIRRHVWSIMLLIDDHYALPHIGAKRSKE